MPAYVFDKKTNELVKVAGNAANADLKDVDLTSKVVLSPKLTSAKCSVTRYGNVVMVYGRIEVNTKMVRDDEILSGLPPLKEDFMYFDAVLFDHTPDVPAGYVRLNYDGRIVANNDIEAGLYRFSMTYITSDEM